MAKSAAPPDLTNACIDMAQSEKGIRIYAVETLVQYRFHNPALLWEALQGPSVIIDSTGKPVPPDGNKRLAIVGDAAIRLALAENWYPGKTSKGKFTVTESNILFRLMQSLGNFSNIATAVGSNANLNKIGLEIGLERFIYGVFGGKTIADTVEAILGAVFLDSGLKKVKDVMDTLDLVSKARRLENILESEGLVMFDGKEEEDVPAMAPTKKRRRSGP